MIRRTLLISMFILLVVLNINMVGGDDIDVTATYNGTRTLEWHDYDVYVLHPSQGQRITVTARVLNGTEVDFYVFTENQFNLYENESRMFVVTWDSEEVVSCSWSTTSSTVHCFVVDNMIYSDTGAFPLDNVTYEITVQYEDIITHTEPTDDSSGGIFSWFYDNICLSVCGILILMAIITCMWFFTTPKQGPGQPAPKQAPHQLARPEDQKKEQGES